MFKAISGITKRFFGNANERELNKLLPLVEQVNAFESSIQALDDEQLRAKTAEFRGRIEAGESVDDLLPEAFAVVREVGWRVLSMRHFDCQLLGGIVLHKGMIAEMKTGEGKTLVATLPVYLNALSGKGAHVVTVNDYLAERDANWMRPIYEFLDMTVGVILQGERDEKVKQAAYGCDITYGTNNEFGFDYLRDNMKFSFDQMVQRGHNFAIIDEVDSILIDEARTPLIISGPMRSSIDTYTLTDSVIPLLQEEIDFVVDEKAKGVNLTDEGIGKVERKLGIDNLYDPQNMEVLHHVSQSLKAHHIFKRDRDYVVRENKVVIVDEFTGRLMHGRRWSDGLHQAVEAKEKVRVEQESQVYATITFQNLFRMYDKLSGMTGTADTEAAEFADIYDLDTRVIPTNKPLARDDQEDIVYRTQVEKFRAVTDQILECHKAGQPVLVGTTSVEKSEIVARSLEKAGVPHEILNAKNHSREAIIVAQAGRLKSVTISTNMAGRGTDIKLGGNPEELTKEEVGHAVWDEAVLPGMTGPNPETHPDLSEVFARYVEECDAECAKVKDVGGLFIVGTERHESRRVDNQLRGRAGRQGDVGGSRFYLSLEDDLMRMFGSEKMTTWMERMGIEDDEPIVHHWISSAIANAQKKVEGYNFNIRKNLLEYDDVMNYQRKGVYEIRRRALKGEDMWEMAAESLQSVVQDIMDDFLEEGRPEHWNLDGLRGNMERVFGLRWDDDDDESLRDHSRHELIERLTEEATAVLEAKREDLSEKAFDEVAQMLFLQFTDNLWKDHLLALDRLRQGVGLRGYGQRNPLLEYKREALQMYMMMSAMRDEEVLKRLLRVELQTEAPVAETPAAPAAAASLGDALSGASAAIGDVVATPEPVEEPTRPAKGKEARDYALANKIRRNDPCPCGSGKKLKKCCGASL